MPSIRSHLYALALTGTRKRAFLSAERMRASVAAARPFEDYRPPRQIVARMSIEEREIAGMPVYEVSPRTGAGRRRILYMHGGACLFEITRHHWKLIAWLAERLDARVTVPIYPLAPEHKATEIIARNVDVYRYVLAETPAEHVSIVGDSAGGNLAIVISMSAALDGLPSPASLVLISPALDPSMTNPRVEEVAKNDPWLAVAGGQEATRLYAGGLPFDDWRITPINGDLAALPPSLVLTGTRDILNPDTHLFVDKARQSGVDIELVEAPGMFHVWPLLEMPEAYVARERIAMYLQATASGETFMEAAE